MKRFKKLLVILPAGTPQQALLAWARSLANASTAEAIDLMRCKEDELNVYPGIEIAAEDSTSDDFEVLPGEVLDGLPYRILERKGDPLKEALTLLSDGHYDLVITSSHDSEARILAERLARKSPIGVLALPAKSIAPPSAIVASIDFSDLSPLCIEWAEAFAALESDEPIRKEVLHTMDMVIPARATLTVSEDVIRDHIRAGAEMQMKNLLDDHAKTKDNWFPMLVESRVPSQALIRRTAQDSNTLIILGCHGRNAFSNAILGSQACDAIRRSTGPVLVAKRKNENLKFLRDLLGIN